MSEQTRINAMLLFYLSIFVSTAWSAALPATVAVVKGTKQEVSEHAVPQSRLTSLWVLELRLVRRAVSMFWTRLRRFIGQLMCTDGMFHCT